MKQSKNSTPSSIFEAKDRCPSCGSYCDIEKDLDKNDYCNDCRIMLKQATLIFVPVKTLKESKRFGKFESSNGITRWSGIGGAVDHPPFQPKKAILIGKDGSNISDNLKPMQIEKIIKNNYHCQYEMVDGKLKIVI